ncbi:family 43 glycosylhydrolase [Hymenobacter sp. NST-14]|uniref:family 43 glycosylhydrolase n=1 Tax=Hymenobacter piscis TaxID=2839984 RepID=UPI001C035EA5|nr:family 43 glycosylhydrolase [Hymenobacter piscis]MBT9394836.1 family 43 glycosylhydrolase [Hymenobacter piscis]
MMTYFPELIRRPGRVIGRLLLVLVLLGGLTPRAHALQGVLGAHDPSTIVKDGNKYWVFTTGQGVGSLYSTDLINWQPGPRPVFVNNGYPAWINPKVPGFQGNFWAPECVFMNGKYYLYYSCSTFGSNVSAIGLATNVTLDPSSPNYNWVDEGEVISTNSGSNVNAIDPAIFRDTNDEVWLSYGSFFGGIRITQLSATTGKVLNAGNQAAVVSNDPEAAYLTKHGGYYYMFFNRGSCCRGVNSTYYIMVGRSTSPTGPYLDQNGVSLNNGGGTLVLNVSGRYVGPGHAGTYEENGTTYFSHHYYDGDDNGAPKLGLTRLTWDAAAWPVVSRDWVTSGRYEIRNQNSKLVWEARGCTGAAGQAIAQATPTGLDCQRWDFAALGDGEYRLTSAVGGLTASVAGCSPDNGALLQLDPYVRLNCQRFVVDRANDGTLVLASSFGNRVVDVPVASTAPGRQLGLFDYNGCPCQRWVLGGNAVLAASAARPLAGVRVYPVPASRSGFTVELGALPTAGATRVEVYDLRGRRVYQGQFPARPVLTVEVALLPGVYLVRVQRPEGVFTQKISVI